MRDEKGRFVKGHKQTDEVKRKLSEAMAGKPGYWTGKKRVFSEEHCENIGHSLRGKKFGPQSEDHKRKSSEAHKKDVEDITSSAIHLRINKKIINDETMCIICNIKNKDYDKLYGRSLDCHCYDKNHKNLSDDNWFPICGIAFGCQGHKLFHGGQHNAELP